MNRRHGSDATPRPGPRARPPVASRAMSTAAALLLALHLTATAAMVGTIWFVQIVHYPLFAAVGPDRFVAYEQRHTRLTAFVVGPPMAVEGVTALVLAWSPPGDLSRILPVLGLVLLAVVHASTVLLQVPRHQRLSVAHDDRTIATLVSTNWIRTAGWSARGALAVAMVVLAS